MLMLLIHISISTKGGITASPRPSWYDHMPTTILVVYNAYDTNSYGYYMVMLVHKDPVQWPGVEATQLCASSRENSPQKMHIIYVFNQLSEYVECFVYTATFYEYLQLPNLVLMAKRKFWHNAWEVFTLFFLSTNIFPLNSPRNIHYVIMSKYISLEVGKLLPCILLSVEYFVDYIYW